MEKYLFKLINNKHLLYIILEYSRKEHTFLKELKENTESIYERLDEWDNCLLEYHKILRYNNNWYFALHF